MRVQSLLLTAAALLIASSGCGHSDPTGGGPGSYIPPRPKSVSAAQACEILAEAGDITTSAYGSETCAALCGDDARYICVVPDAFVSQVGALNPNFVPRNTSAPDAAPPIVCPTGSVTVSCSVAAG